MSSVNVFQIAQDMNGPPGLVHPFLVENYAWVDERLREMYNVYALTASNCDEYEAAGLLSENYAWVDARLAEKCVITAEDYLHRPTQPTCLRHCIGREYDESSVESYIGHKRKRDEAGLSCNLDCKCYNEFTSDMSYEEESLSVVSYEEESLSSLDLDSDGVDNKNASFDEIYEDDDNDYDCDGYDSP